MHMLKKGKVMQEIKVIIGASYGDEGKGLATDFFGAQAESRHPAHLTSDMVNVLSWPMDAGMSSNISDPLFSGEQYPILTGLSW